VGIDTTGEDVAEKKVEPKSDGEAVAEKELELAHDLPANSADEFLDHLKFIWNHSRIGVSDSSTVLFRGQRDSTWGLVPGICRDNWITKMREYIPIAFRPDKLDDDGDWTMWDRAAIEHAAVLTFIHFADEAGIRLPGYTPEMQSSMFVNRVNARQAASSKSIPGGWMDNFVDRYDYDALIALTQHYEIPTRLLDFSLSPYVAAYFAANTAYMHSSNPPAERIAVWGMTTGDDGKFFQELKWRLVQVPKQANERMRVQQAAFVTTYYPTLEELNTDRGLDSLAMDNEMSGQMLCRVTLPYTNVQLLLKELDDLGISDRTMLPGYEGVTRYMKTKAKMGEEIAEFMRAHSKRERKSKSKIGTE
jgi:FRG domain